jgi:hypothetical protein
MPELSGVPATEEIMNYILKMQKIANCQQGKLGNAELAYAELRDYLLSSKFHEDPTVQVQDILNRMDAIRDAIRGV